MLNQEGAACWGVWPPQRQDVKPEYRYAIASGVGMLPYNIQTGSYESLQTQVTSLNYTTNHPYNVVHLATSYVPSPSYHTSTSVTGSSAYRPVATTNDTYIMGQLDPQWQLPMRAPSPPKLDESLAYHQGAGETSVHHCQSPLMSVKAEPQQLPNGIAAVSTRENTPVLAPEALLSENSLNTVMLVIQSKTEPRSAAGELNGLPVTGNKDAGSQPRDTDSLVAQDQPGLSNTRLTPKKKQAKSKARRPFRCEFVGCNMAFSQRARLECHVRFHTGEKPFICAFPGCGKAFSQTSNRTTHHRGHTGEAPFQCYICSKRFTNGGNLQPHIKTHFGIKEYVCKLDNCGKQASTKGNLKTHQTKYHDTTLKALARRVSEAKDLESASQEDRKMVQYLVSVHNNLNKGIKGCGGSRIRRVTGSPDSTQPSTPASMVPYNNGFYEPFTGHLQASQHIPPMHLPNVLGHPTLRGISRQNAALQAPNNIHMYDSDMEGLKGSIASPSSTATLTSSHATNLH